MLWEMDVWGQLAVPEARLEGVRALNPDAGARAQKRIPGAQCGLGIACCYSN